jgi:predicted HTH domain antitoxin
MKMVLEIPDGLAAALPQDDAERGRHVLLELACGMFATGRLTHAQAAGLAGLGRLHFDRELGRREIPIRYNPEDWKDDLAAGLCGE